MNPTETETTPKLRLVSDSVPKPKFRRALMLSVLQLLSVYIHPRPVGPPTHRACVVYFIVVCVALISVICLSVLCNYIERRGWRCALYVGGLLRCWTTVRCVHNKIYPTLETWSLELTLPPPSSLAF